MVGVLDDFAFVCCFRLFLFILLVAHSNFSFYFHPGVVSIVGTWHAVEMVNGALDLRKTVDRFTEFLVVCFAFLCWYSIWNFTIFQWHDERTWAPRRWQAITNEICCSFSETNYRWFIAQQAFLVRLWKYLNLTLSMHDPFRQNKIKNESKHSARHVDACADGRDVKIWDRLEFVI